MFTFLLVVQAIIAAFLVGVILVQRSEGGGLGTGGSPAGLMSARGASNFLTRATAILASAFILLSIGLAFLAAREHPTSDIDTSLAKQGAPTEQSAPAPAQAPPSDDPLAAAAQQAGATPAAPAAPAPATPSPAPTTR
ncbi:MAG: preprotein translocase subunit SecG [Sphingomonas sanxanigenens]|uniref:Protein-export membrane protein SecG n=1 Tax=Sphingomonas sanxanigenens TaxID=397260 RepID=A0A2W5C5B8_9SPHN|nr:MAG: preprotein translocase subunit SecG [Sphingomonas sanxanigenens]